ncbi:trna pseudouridine(38 39) synthase [Nannochloropsis oceanica]
MDSLPPPPLQQEQLQLQDVTREQLCRVVQHIMEQDGGKALVHQALDMRTRQFDFSKHATRFIALQFSYEGAPYNGLASNGEDEIETVEAQLLMACIKLKLIPDRASACVSRCGRTDKGVNALRQVVGLRVRSALPLSDTSSVSSPFTVDAPAPTTTAAGDADDATAMATSTCTPLVQYQSSCSDGCITTSSSSSSTTTTTTTTTTTHNNDVNEAKGQDLKDTSLNPVALLADGDIWSIPYPSTTSHELDYATLLNRVLPPDIRALGWAPVPPGFSARFCCAHRTYRYFFDGEGLDLEKMREGARKLVGQHDFRNFCKMDVTTVQSFVRLVKEAEILEVGEWKWVIDSKGKPLSSSSSSVSKGRSPSSSRSSSNPTASSSSSSSPPPSSHNKLCCLQIQGQAFLWHMVRCIMSILFTIGRKQESPGIVDDLLNIALYPAKPHYPLASEHALVLHDCHFAKLKFTYQPSALFRLWTELRMGWGAAAVKLARLNNHLEYVGELEVSRNELEQWADTELKEGRFQQGQQRRQQQNQGEGKRRKKEGEGGRVGDVGGEDISVDGSGKGSDDGDCSNDDRGKEEEEEMVMIKWRDALAFLSTRGIVPDLEESKKRKGIWTPYIPLRDRPLGKSYEEAVAEMGAKKRELYKQAQKKRETAERKGGMADFFLRMRGTTPTVSSSRSSNSSTISSNSSTISSKCSSSGGSSNCRSSSGKCGNISDLQRVDMSAIYRPEVGERKQGGREGEKVGLQN